MPLYEIESRRPLIHPTAWVAPNATVIGDVELGPDSSLWWNTVLRGDTDRICIGAGSNIQDGSVLHTDPGLVLQVGDGVTVGHMVMLHGCQIGDGCLIGIGAVVLNRAVIGKRSIVAANTLIPEGKTYPDGVLIMGSPGKVVRELTDEDFARLQRNAATYVRNAQRYRSGLQLIVPCPPEHP